MSQKTPPNNEDKIEDNTNVKTEEPKHIKEDTAATLSEILAPNTGFEVKNFTAQIAGFFSLLAAATFAFIRKK